ncbi:MAG: M15 family metallopeptidase [Gaiellaceae bacterium]
MLRLLALPLALVALQQYESSVRPLPGPLERSLLKTDSWKPGCPVALEDLRFLTVSHWGFDGRRHVGQLVVNEDVAAPLQKVFRQLYRLEFPIRHMRLDDMYGPRRARPADGDITGSFRCRQAVPSPCVGGSGSGSWSNHAYGHAIDLNPVENPYVGCGQTRDPTSVRYMDRSRVRKGMITPAVVRAFRAIGWGWGGEWSGRTKDYMHFSTTGH